MNEYRIGTKCVQGGYTPGNGEPRQIPIVQSTTFKYATSEDMGKLFDLEASGYFYTRLQNPTNDCVAAKIADLEGGVAAILTSSGQAACFYSIFNICEAGDHFVCSSTVYGGTFNLFGVTLKKMGIDVTFVDPNASDEELLHMITKHPELFDRLIEWEKEDNIFHRRMTHRETPSEVKARLLSKSQTGFSSPKSK